MKTSAGKYRLIFEHAGEGILVIQGLKIILANPQAAEMLGYSEEEIKSGLFTDYVHPDDRPGVLRHYTGRLQGEALPRRKQFRMVTGDQEEKWVEVNVVVISWEGRPALLIFLNDIAERKKAERITRSALRALRESNRLFTAAVKAARSGVWDYRVETGELHLSAVWKTQLGFREDERVGTTLDEAADLLHPDDRQRVLDYLRHYVHRPQGEYEIQFRIRHKDGLYHWIISRAAPLLDKEGRVRRLIGFHFDASEKISAANRIRDLSNRLGEYERLLDLSQMLIRDTNHRIVYWTTGSEHLYGWPRKEALGRKAGELFRTSYPQPLSRIEAELLTRGTWDGELIRRKQDGTPITVASHWVLERDEQGLPHSILEMDNDITALKKAEAEIRRLSLQLVQSQEDERRKISCELHDAIGPSLSLVIMELEGLGSRAAEETPDFETKIKKLSRILKDTVKNIRELSYILNPPGLHEFGLLNTVRKLVREMALEKHLEIDFTCTGIVEESLKPDLRIAVYRLIQEGLLNIVKHARAGKATVRLVRSSPYLILRLEDDGRGFDVQERLATAPSEKHFGLRNMRERAALLGGRLEVKSILGKGTLISIQLPLEGGKNEAPQNRALGG